MSREEEAILQQRLFGSVQSLYGSIQVQRLKKKNFAYCGEIGHFCRQCPLAQGSGFREVRGIPTSRLIPSKNGTLYHQQGYFGEIIANEKALACDFRSRYGMIASIKQKENKLEILNHYHNSMNVAPEIDLSKVVSPLSFESRPKVPKNSTLATETNHSRDANDYKRFRSNYFYEKFIANLVQNRAIAQKKRSPSRCLKPMNSILSAVLSLLPKGDIDLIVFAFGTHTPLSEKEFQNIQAEIKYRRDLNKFFRSMTWYRHATGKFPTQQRISLDRNCVRERHRSQSYLRFGSCFRGKK